MTRKKLLWLILPLAFLWMAFVYASFYLVQQQRPFTAAQLQAIGSTLLDLVTAGALLAIASLVGYRICALLKVQCSPAEGLVWGTGLGLGAIGLSMFGLGLLGWLSRWAVVGLLSLLLFVSAPALKSLASGLSSLRSISLPGRWTRAYLAAMLLLTLLVALAPPLDWDGLFYHLVFPRHYIEQGQIVPVTDVPHQYYPGLMEMLYTAAMLLKGDSAAKLLHTATLCLLLGGVYLVARRHLSKELGWPAVTVAGAIPMIWVLGSWAYNDLALAFYQVAALYAFLTWAKRDERPWLVVSAVFCGLAAGYKYTAFVCPLTIGLLVCWQLLRQRAAWQRWLATVSLFCAVVFLVAVPWYARNLVVTGNPVYPFAYDLFGGPGWDAWRADWYARPGTGLGTDLGEWVKLPWTMTLGLRDMNFHDGRAGPLFLLALPFVVLWLVRGFGRPGARPRAMGVLLFYAFVQAAFWAFGVANSRSLFQSRLLLPALAALCGPLAYLYDELGTLDTRLFSLRRLVGMTVVLVLAANLCYHMLAVVQTNPLPVLVGQEDQEAFLTRNLGAYYAAMEMVNEYVGEGERVLFLWEPRSYYCQRDVQPDPILERWAWLLHLYQEPDRIADALQSDGYAYVMLYRAGLARVQAIGLDPTGEREVSLLESFVADYLVETSRVGDAYVLYALSMDGAE
jgi:4-amino-4-deoxy-L-arabinose transferase-like glycosyltransferase